MLERNMTKNVHQLIAMHLQQSPSHPLVAVDATLGNGHDLAFLLEQNNIKKIYGFDIQKEAIETCKKKILKTEKQVMLIHDSHEYFERYIHEPVDLILFNLGYLPGGTKTITTKKNSSLEAIKKGLERLNKGGVMTVMTYPGHLEGAVEHEAIHHYLSGLVAQDMMVFKISMENTINKCPNILFIKK